MMQTNVDLRMKENYPIFIFCHLAGTMVLLNRNFSNTYMYTNKMNEKEMDGAREPKMGG
jgi:hypothetical protein